MRVVTFKVDDELLKMLDLTASRLGVPRSELIREAIIKYLSRSSPAKRRGYLRVRHVVLT